jgi:hypothetical protein
MITAIDTNILFDILLPNKAFYEASEMFAHFEKQRECDQFMDATATLSRDRGFYHRMFPSLEIFDPSRTIRR